MSNSKKIILAGHFGVGKSSLVSRFVNNFFSEEYKVTIGVQILKKEIEIEKTKFNFIIWDIEGKSTLQEMRTSYLIGTQAFVYVVDPLRESTFTNLKEDLEYITVNYPKAFTIVVSNKSDLISKKELDILFKEKDLKIDFYASAKTGENVENIFEKLGSKFLNL